jgi:hypothetical protein
MVLCPVCGEAQGDLGDHDWGQLESIVVSCGMDFLLIRHVSVRYEGVLAGARHEEGGGYP